MQGAPTSPYVPDLAALRAWLEKMVRAMKFLELVVAVVALVARMRDINLELTKRVAHLTRKRPRSETLERLERQLLLPLPGLVASAVKPPAAAESKPQGAGKQRHGGGGRGAFPAYIPRVEVKNLVPTDLRICPQCGQEMKTVAHSVCETINVIPARFFIEHRLDETVACPTDDTIVSAPPPPAIVERGKLGDTLIVEATCDKYIEHQPVERQCVRFERTGVEVAPQTLGRCVAAHIELLMPVAELIAEQTRAPGYLGTDATGIPVLDPSVTEGMHRPVRWHERHQLHRARRRKAPGLHGSWPAALRRGSAEWRHARARGAPPDGPAVRDRARFDARRRHRRKATRKTTRAQ